MAFMDEVDRVGARITVGAAIGMFFGAGIGIFRGHSSITRTALSTGANWAIVGTACFGTERLGNYIFKEMLIRDDQQQQQDGSDKKLKITSEQTARLLIASHAFGGLLGGGITGYLYVRRPLRGMVFFVPVMMLVSLGEMKFEKMRQERLLRASGLEHEEEEHQQNEEEKDVNNIADEQKSSNQE